MNTNLNSSIPAPRGVTGEGWAAIAGAVGSAFLLAKKLLSSKGGKSEHISRVEFYAELMVLKGIPRYRHVPRAGGRFRGHHGALHRLLWPAAGSAERSSCGRARWSADSRACPVGSAPLCPPPDRALFQDGQGQFRRGGGAGLNSVPPPAVASGLGGRSYTAWLQGGLRWLLAFSFSLD